jgi:hypothetical protein
LAAVLVACAAIRRNVVFFMEPTADYFLGETEEIKISMAVHVSAERGRKESSFRADPSAGLRLKGFRHPAPHRSG